MKELSHINKYFVKYKHKIILGVVIVACAKIFSLFTPQLIGDIITLVALVISPQSPYIYGLTILKPTMPFLGPALSLPLRSL